MSRFLRKLFCKVKFQNRVLKNNKLCKITSDLKEGFNLSTKKLLGLKAISSGRITLHLKYIHEKNINLALINDQAWVQMGTNFVAHKKVNT